MGGAGSCCSYFPCCSHESETHLPSSVKPEPSSIKPGPPSKKPGKPSVKPGQYSTRHRLPSTRLGPSSTKAGPPSRNLKLPKETKTSKQPSAPSDSSFTKSGLSKINPLDLISGYEHEPVGSLEEALTPFYGKIDHLSDYVQEAKTKCHYPSEHGLTRDESAAIYIYTKKWGNGSLYDHLQTAWESNDKAKMKPWLKFLKLFKDGYDKLPDAQGEVSKGKPFDPRLEEELDSASASFYTTMDIFFASEATQQRSLGDNTVNEDMSIGLQDVDAKDAHGYGADNHHEILVFPGSRVAVDRKDRNEDNISVMYHLKRLSVIEGPKPKPVIVQHYICPERS